MPRPYGLPHAPTEEGKGHERPPPPTRARRERCSASPGERDGGREGTDEAREIRYGPPNGFRERA
ncbi:hypothetical protein GCM10020366_53160 [Saccharopolyspora gregorii]|uniref:Uncharacterized protein n=1 Tax=Saccharopolyspora gregorii TaxID=33914 RepID=A0ABP6RXU8_9PSEU